MYLEKKFKQEEEKRILLEAKAERRRLRAIERAKHITSQQRVVT